MRTAIISDLHLGNSFGEDVLRDAEIRRVLLDEIASGDRLILLGDVLELRELPLATALAQAQAFFEELGATVAGKEVVLVPGNHDHRLAEPLLEHRALVGESVGLEQRSQPSGELGQRIAAWLGGASLEIAYPGIWLRADVYATHGHYMDCHMSLPRAECVAAAATMRTLRPLPTHPTPSDYEHVLQPVYGLTYGLAQGGSVWGRARPSERAWRALASNNGNRPKRIRRAALRAAVPAAVWTINRLLRSDLDPDLSAATITHSGIAAATEMSARLGLDGIHVITGHTHRAGPEQSDPTWELPGDGHLHNTGSWVFASAFHRPGTPPGPYWPGTVTWVEDDGPPKRVRLLNDDHEDQMRNRGRLDD